MDRTFSRRIILGLSLGVAFGLALPEPAAAQGAGPFQFHTLTPCRLVDTRNPNGPSGGPILASLATRSFPVQGLCGVPVGAKAVAIGHSALMALNCNKEIPGVTDYEGTIGVPAGQCYHCHTGRCPVGITTQDPELRKRLVVEDAAERVYNFLHTLTLEVQMLARACGKTNVHSLEPEDLCALTVEAAAMAKVPLAGTEWIPGVSEERTLAEMKRMLEKHLEYPVDYLPSQVEEAVPD